MGLVIEFLAAFFLIVYVGGRLISDGVSSASCKRQRASENERERVFKEKVINDELEKEYIHSVREDESFRRDVEKECLEVFAELPSWRWLKTWDPLSYWVHPHQWEPSVRGLTKKETREVTDEICSLHTYVAELIYFANRGYIYWYFLLWQYPQTPHDVFARIRSVTSRSDMELFLQMQKELMIWWRDKLHSFGIEDDLLSWHSVYNAETKEKMRVYYRIEDAPNEKDVRSVIFYVWKPYIPEQEYRRLA